MDHDQFDSLTRQLASRTGSRRGILQAMTIGTASITLGAIGLSEATAKKKKKKCKKPKVKCGKKCCSPPAPIFRFAANPMTDENEVPPGAGDPNGSGSAQFTIQGSTICGTFTFDTDPDSPVTGMHIHPGAAGQENPPAVDFTAATLGSPLCVPCPGTVCADIVTNPSLFYANTHTSAFPNGAVRAQLQAVPS